MTTYLRRNQASLYLDTLLLTGQTTDSTGNIFTIESQDAGSDWGSAQPIEVAVQRWMADGAVAAIQGYENRIINFQVKIAAATSVALAAGETALVKAARSAAVLKWVSPEGPVAAPVTVFDIWTVVLDSQFNIDEENRLTRAYQVTATAKPWARSATVSTVAAVPTSGAATTTLIDACTVITGWTGTPNTPTVVSGAIRETKNVNAGPTPIQVLLTLTRTGSVTGLGTQPYLAIDMGYAPSFSNYTSQTLTVKVDGVLCTKVGSVGTTQYWQVPAGVTSFTTLLVTATTNVANFNGPVSFEVRDVSKTDKFGATATHKMFSRHLDVGGAVPTSGSIQIASPSATVLGNTLVYSCPDLGSSYSPPIRSYRTSGGTVLGDATYVSGVKETLFTTNNNVGATITYSIPSQILREGSYAIVVRTTSDIAGGSLGNGNFRLKFSTTQADGTTLLDSIERAIAVNAPAEVVWAVLGVISIPGVARPPESTLATVLQLACTQTLGVSGTKNVYLDEVFLLDVSHGAFSLVTSPVSFKNLWLDSPDVDAGKNRPEIYYGANADRSDAAAVPYGQVLSVGDHDLDPDGAMMFTVTDNVDDAGVSASFYRRWHTNAAA
jgi:hypothetical protein